MGRLKYLKQSRLAGFTWVLEAGIVIGEDMGAMLPGHPIKPLFTALGKNNRIRGANGRQIVFIRLPAGTKDIGVRLVAGMKRENHQYPNLRSALVSRVQFF